MSAALRILALDGALGAFSCAYDDGERVVTRSVDAKSALETGLAAVAAVLDEAGVSLREVDRVAVGIGPGGFTGLRIAISFAKPLAAGAAKPLVGISSFDALEPEGAPPRVAAFVMGRPGIACVRLRTAGSASVRCGPLRELVEHLQGCADPLAVAGATEDELAALAEGGIIVRTLPRRAAIAAVAIAGLARAASPAASPHAVRPDYGELPAVTLPKAGR